MIATIVGAALVAGLATRWWLGVVMAGLLVGATRHERARASIAGVAVTALGLASAYVVLQQIRYGAPHDGAWPSLWDRAHLLGWLALVALGAEWCLALFDPSETGEIPSEPDEHD